MDGKSSRPPQNHSYTCMLWNVRSGQRTVVTILREHEDRWTGRRCQTTLTSFEAPVESFPKSHWRRDEQPHRRGPDEAHVARDARDPRFWKNFKVAVRP